VHILPGRLVTFVQIVVCVTGPSPVWAETRRRPGKGEPRVVPRRGSDARPEHPVRLFGMNPRAIEHDGRSGLLLRPSSLID
jgi:hypothetical protein